MIQEPRVVKIADSGVLYMNEALVKGIKQTISQPSATIDPNDTLYFCRDVKFRRDLLTIAEHNFARCINIEKANCFIVNPNIEFPVYAYGLVGGKISKDIPLDEADDIVYNLSQMGEEYIKTIQQWIAFFKLEKKPKVIHEADILKYVNTGVVIDENNFDNMQDLLKSDFSMACSSMNICDIEKSLPFILYLLFFHNGNVNSRAYTFDNHIPNIKTYLMQRNSWHALSKEMFNKILDNDFLNARLSGVVQAILNKSINTSGAIKTMVENLNVDFTWKR